jgi:hypothetical protein
MAEYKKIKAATSFNIDDGEELDFDERLVKGCLSIGAISAIFYLTWRIPEIIRKTR